MNQCLLNKKNPHKPHLPINPPRKDFKILTSNSNCLKRSKKPFASQNPLVVNKLKGWVLPIILTSKLPGRGSENKCGFGQWSEKITETNGKERLWFFGQRKIRQERVWVCDISFPYFSHIYYIRGKFHLLIYFEIHVWPKIYSIISQGITRKLKNNQTKESFIFL